VHILAVLASSYVTGQVPGASGGMDMRGAYEFRSPPAMGMGQATAYYPPVDSSSPAAAEHSAEVGGALVPRTAQISADIYQLIVREIPQVSGDTRVLKLLEASVGENVATALHVIQHGMAAAGRYLNLRLRIPDRPGGLAELRGDPGSLGPLAQLRPRGELR